MWKIIALVGNSHIDKVNEVEGTKTVTGGRVSLLDLRVIILLFSESPVAVNIPGTQ